MSTLVDDYGQSMMLIVFGLGVIAVMTSMVRWSIETVNVADTSYLEDNPQWAGIDMQFDSVAGEELNVKGHEQYNNLH